MLLSNQCHDRVTYDEAAGQLADLCEKLERERDEARDAFAIATDQCVVAQGKLREAIAERDEARLQYSTTLVFCQSLVKARLEQMEVAE